MFDALLFHYFREKRGTQTHKQALLISFYLLAKRIFLVQHVKWSVEN